MVNWEAVNKFQLEEKRKYLKKITIKESYNHFQELYKFAQKYPGEGLSRIDKYKLDKLINWRKSMDSLKVNR